MAKRVFRNWLEQRVDAHFSTFNKIQIASSWYKLKKNYEARQVEEVPENNKELQIQTSQISASKIPKLELNSKDLGQINTQKK